MNFCPRLIINPLICPIKKSSTMSSDVINIAKLEECETYNVGAILKSHVYLRNEHWSFKISINVWVLSTVYRAKTECIARLSTIYLSCDGAWFVFYANVQFYFEILHIWQHKRKVTAWYFQKTTPNQKVYTSWRNLKNERMITICIWF